MKPQLRDLLGQAYSAKVLGRGSVPTALLAFRTAFAADPDIEAAAREELARCEAVTKKRKGCAIEIENANLLRAALAQTEVTNG